MTLQKEDTQSHRHTLRGWKADRWLPGAEGGARPDSPSTDTRGLSEARNRGGDRTTPETD